MAYETFLFFSVFIFFASFLLIFETHFSLKTSLLSSEMRLLKIILTTFTTRPGLILQLDNLTECLVENKNCSRSHVKLIVQKVAQLLRMIFLHLQCFPSKEILSFQASFHLSCVLFKLFKLSSLFHLSCVLSQFVSLFLGSLAEILLHIDANFFQQLCLQSK